MAKVNIVDQVQAMENEDKVKKLISKQVRLPATIIGGKKSDGKETIQYRCAYCGHTWSRHYKNQYIRANQPVECPKCQLIMAPGRKLPDDGICSGHLFELWDGNEYHFYYRVLFIDAAELNGEKGLWLAVYEGGIEYHFSDRATHFEVKLEKLEHGFISNNYKVIFKADGKRTTKMVFNAFYSYNCGIFATAEAMAQIPNLIWMKGYVDFKSHYWLCNYDRYRDENRPKTEKSLGEAQAEQTMSLYEIPDMPKLENTSEVIFRREKSEDILTGEHLMEYLCKKCGSRFFKKVKSPYANVECPTCGCSSTRHSYGDYTSVSSNTAIITMLGENTVFIRAGILKCDCDENWKLTHQMDEYYRTFITLNPGNEPKICFLAKEGCKKDVWKQKKNYVSDKFRFSIFQLEFIGELDALKYTGFKEYVTERMSVQSYNPLLTLQDMISYLRFQSMYPVIEQLCKRGFSTTLTDEIHHRLAQGNFLCIDFSGKKITDALAIPERLIKIYLKDNDSSFRLKHFQALYRIDENVREEDIDWIDLHGVYDEQIGAVIDESPMSIMRVCEYLEHVRINQCYEPKNAISDWRDYLKAAKTIEVDLTDNKAKYPSSLKREHDRAIAKQQVILDSKKEETFKAETEEYGRLYSHKDKNFMIIPPKDMKDLFEEGRKLNHCVGSYSDRIIQGNTCIMFVRKVEEPDKPYFTIEISRGGRHIVQLRANSNRLINHSTEKELVKFIRDWAKKKNLALNGVV